MDIASKWGLALLRAEECPPVLGDLAELIGAGSILMSRHDHDRDRGELLHVHEPSRGKLMARARRSMAWDVFGGDLQTMRPGALVRHSDLRRHEALDDISDLALAVLGRRQSTTELLEFQFDRVPLPHDMALLEIMMPVFARSWSRVHDGTAAGAERPQVRVADLLDPDNPAGLTRSEFRICGLIEQGRLPQEIVNELCISLATFRSHMRSVYIKTGVSGQLELSHLLHAQSLHRRRAQSRDQFASHAPERSGPVRRHPA